MKVGIIRFPGSNCDEDAWFAVVNELREQAVMLWHKDHELQGSDVIILPGGFSYGDYLRAGAIARFSPIMQQVAAHAARGGIEIHGYEMLKGLEGVRTHEHREWLPILENSQDMTELSQRVAKLLRENCGLHGFLLREHGLYTWGATLQEAKRHVEILEFLMEVLVRASTMPRPENAETTGD